MIDFRLDARSGVPTYLQLVQQVKRALRLGMLEVGDQLPTVREVVASIAINPNTVLKGYRELEREGLVTSRPGQGTFVRRALGEVDPSALLRLRSELRQWIERARRSGLQGEVVVDLMQSTFREVDEAPEVTA
ncbi:MAG: GntR family transcriptional regulator [Candidatus Dormibacteraceae bacterium]